MPPISLFPFLRDIPPGTRLLTSLVLGGTLAAWFLSAFLEIKHQGNPRAGTFTVKVAPWLVLYPSESWKFPWTLLTAGFVEGNIIELAISVTSLILATRYLERIWGFVELIRFSFIVVVLSNVVAFGFSWIAWFILGQDEFINGTPYHGLSALQIGFLVAFTQLIPEHSIQIFGSLRVRVKTLPGLYLLLSNVLTLVLSPSPYMLVQFGFPISWGYLRFFKLSEDGLTRGDRSETFAFQYWFPPPVRPIIARVADQVYKVAVRSGVVSHWEEPVLGYGLVSTGGGARAEAERRRALALKALDARMASAPAQPPAGAASLSTDASSGSGAATQGSAPAAAAAPAVSTTSDAAATTGGASTATTPAVPTSVISDPIANAAAAKATGEAPADVSAEGGAESGAKESEKEGEKEGKKEGKGKKGKKGKN